MAGPTPSEVKPWYLRNLSEALYLDGSDQVTLRTGFTGNISIGNVNIPGTVAVSSLGSVDITGPTMPVSGTVAVSSLPPITGTVSVSNFPATQTVSVSNFPATQTVNGTVSATVSGTVAVSGVAGTVTIADGGGSITVDGSVNATIQGTPTVALSSTQTDAFGRLRVSNPYTLFDSKNLFYDHDEYSSAISGGSVTYNASSSTYDLIVAGNAGNSIIRETKKVFPYQPGKSLLIFTTFCMTALINGVTQRVGFYGQYNGIYFEVVNSTLNMVIRSSSTGAIVEDRIPQTSWNGDKLNGTGPSGITLDPTKTQIFWIDVEWLGVGSVRTGFIIDGTFYTAHTFHHANQPGNTTTYMGSATLPLRYEIINTATVGFPSTLRQICQSVISEGGYVFRGTTQTAGTGITPKRLTTAGTYYPMVSMRLAPGRMDSVVGPTQVDVLSPTVNYYRWALLLNPTLTGPVWNNSTTGTVQYDTSATAVSGGTELQSGYVSSRELSELGADFFNVQLGRTLAGVSDIVTLVMTATSNNADVLAQLGWTELS